MSIEELADVITSQSEGKTKKLLREYYIKKEPTIRHVSSFGRIYGENNDGGVVNKYGINNLSRINVKIEAYRKPSTGSPIQSNKKLSNLKARQRVLSDVVTEIVDGNLKSDDDIRSCSSSDAEIDEDEEDKLKVLSKSDFTLVKKCTKPSVFEKPCKVSRRYSVDTKTPRVKPTLDVFTTRVSHQSHKNAIKRRTTSSKSDNSSSERLQRYESHNKAILRANTDQAFQNSEPIIKVEETIWTDSEQRGTPTGESRSSYLPGDSNKMIIPETAQSFSVLDELLSFESPRKKPKPGTPEFRLYTGLDLFKTKSPCEFRENSTTRLADDDHTAKRKELEENQTIPMPIKAEQLSSIRSWTYVKNESPFLSYGLDDNLTRLKTLTDCEDGESSYQNRDSDVSVMIKSSEKRIVKANRTSLLEKSVLDDLLDFGSTSMTPPSPSYGRHVEKNDDFPPTERSTSNKNRTTLLPVTSVLDELMG